MTEPVEPMAEPINIDNDNAETNKINSDNDNFYNSLDLDYDNKSDNIGNPNIFLDHLNLTQNNEEKINQEIQEKTVSFDNFKTQNNTNTTTDESHNINSFISNNQYAENATFDNDRVDTDIENELYSATNKSYIDINKEWEENEAKNKTLPDSNINTSQLQQDNITNTNNNNNMTNNIGFDIKESIEKLKAQLNSNNDDTNNQ